ncbi:ester cyclase [Pseudoflavitalea rhizosphaerae]|uniref:ester cyclase n=1 Tax=Pseudoflavitalea rhizosphaerae TaxID=1884793 RepID=UPI000F8D1322|nr:ester cyclase [Pseudoflavitalea rhizosphaerae]
MSINSNKEVVARFNREVIAGKDLKTFDALMAPDFVNHSAPPGVSPAADGMIAFLQNVLWKAFSDIRIDILDQVGEGDKICTRKKISGVHVGEFFGMPATNKRINIEMLEIVRVQNGQYLEHWSIWNYLKVMAQVRS